MNNDTPRPREAMTTMEAIHGIMERNDGANSILVLDFVDELLDQDEQALSRSADQLSQEYGAWLSKLSKNL